MTKHCVACGREGHLSHACPNPPFSKVDDVTPGGSIYADVAAVLNEPLSCAPITDKELKEAFRRQNYTASMDLGTKPTSFVVGVHHQQYGSKYRELDKLVTQQELKRLIDEMMQHADRQLRAELRELTTHTAIKDLK